MSEKISLVTGATGHIGYALLKELVNNGKKPPKIPLSYGVAGAVVPGAELFYKITKKTPLFTRYSIRKLVSNCNFSIEKARKELNYNPMSVEKSVTDMVQWIKENEPKK